MRPVYLKISGFGPYAGMVEIDFEALGTGGLYLITGTTGAGKTTIFDAIAFALYGEPSGETRKTNMLRSQYAAPEMPTEVDLTFRCGGREYRIRRNPEYLRPAKRGSGMTKELAKQELYCPGQAPVTRQKEVDEAVRDIIGLDRNQFAQIAMIAQGEFRKLLKASTEERSRIFQKVFRTQPYEILQRRIQESYKDTAVLRQNAQRSMDQYVQGIQTPAGEPFQALPQIEETLDAIEKMLSLDAQTQAALKAQLDRMEGQIAQANTELASAQAVELARRNLARVQADQTAKQNEQTALETNLEAANAMQPELDARTREAAAIEAQLPQYQQADELAAAQAQMRRNLTACETKRKAAEGNLEQAAKLLDAYRRELADLENAGESKAHLEARLRETTQKIKVLSALVEELDNLEQTRRNLERAQLVFRRDQAAFEEAREDHERKHTAYLSEQAGILAEELEEGKPCPVCGSAQHPNPAKKTVAAPTKAQLAASREAMERARKTAELSSSAAGNQKSVLETRRGNFRDQLEALLGHREEDRARAELEEKLLLLGRSAKELEAAIAGEQKKVNRRKLLQEKLIPQGEMQKQGFDEEVRKQAQAMASGTATLNAQQEQLAQLRAALLYPGRAAAETAIRELRAGIQKLTSRIKEAEKALARNREEMAALEERIKGFREQIADKPAVDLTALTARVEGLKREKTGLAETEKAVHARIQSNQRALDHIIPQVKTLRDLTSRLGWLGALKDTALGDLKGKDKIKLETYVQMTYFDQILNRANQRLQIMSGGQYELVRKKASADGRSQSGLDLDVYDYHNGTTRDAASLSGGESFLASLALALGLADEIQASAGGVQIDTMFVDEGFGSLDDGTLQLAMKALTSLARDNRLVGIISHVTELKERIDKQILVTRLPSGDRQVKIVT